MSDAAELDVVILGGGVAGLWLLDELVRQGRSALLLETVALGNGQTVASQGIIHGGLKYMFDGNLHGPVKAIAEMPVIWRECLAGQCLPNLSGTRILSDGQYIWGTGSLKSWFFLKGSTIALRAAPVPIERSDAPPALERVPGKIMRVPEQVLDPGSMVEHLAGPNRARILHISPDIQLDRGPGGITAVRIRPASGNAAPMSLHPRHVVLSAGEGNAALREKAGLSASAMQRRPLHMVMLRGPLPTLFGHCVGGPKPRVTITTSTDSKGRAVWQIGGQIAEDAVQMDFPQLLKHTREELRVCLPGTNWAGVEFSSYRIDRAEATTATGQRPDDVHIVQDGNILTAWPTKLALAPRMAERVLELLPPGSGAGTPPAHAFPTPPVAPPPWETAGQWQPLE